MSRLLSTLLALLVLGLAVSWLLGPCRPADDLGPGDELVGRPGANVFLVRRADRWWVFDAEARSQAGGRALPIGMLGRPALAADGAILWLEADGLHVQRGPADGVQEPVQNLPAGALPAWLLGVDGRGGAVLLRGPPGESVLQVRSDLGWVAVPTSAECPESVGRGEYVLSPSTRALACPGPDGWEAWSWESLPPVRRVAEGCHGRDAVFTPDGAFLIVDGPVDGLYRLALSDGRREIMARGNLGSSRRVPFAAAFRGDPLLLLAPQRDPEGLLQLFQTHLTGRGCASLTTGGDHHYEPAVAADGRCVAYCQARFDEQGDDPIDETVYCLDLEHGHADELVQRRGGGRGAGPCFVGSASTLVLLAEGRVRRFRP